MDKAYRKCIPVMDKSLGFLLIGETGIVDATCYLHMGMRLLWFSFLHEHNEKTII